MKNLGPEKVAILGRHELASPDSGRKLTEADIKYIVDKNQGQSNGKRSIGIDEGFMK